MDLKTLERGNELHAETVRLSNELKNIQDFLEATGNNNPFIEISDGDRNSMFLAHDYVRPMIDTYISSIKASLKKAQDEFDNLLPISTGLPPVEASPAPDRQKDIAIRKQWLIDNGFRTVNWGLGSPWERRFGDLGVITVDDTLLNDFEVATEANGLPVRDWDAMVLKCKALEKLSQPKEATSGIEVVMINDDAPDDIWYGKECKGAAFNVRQCTSDDIANVPFPVNTDPSGNWTVLYGDWKGSLILKEHAKVL